MNPGIRTITYHINISKKNPEYVENELSRIKATADLLLKENIIPRTCRIVCEPINYQDKREVKNLIKLAKKNDFWGVCIPFGSSTEDDIEFAKEIISDNVFVNFTPIGKDNAIDLDAVSMVSSLIKDISRENSFSNFNLGVSTSPNLNTPFFPFAKTNHNDSYFSIGLELVGAMTDAVKSNNRKSLSEIRNVLINLIKDYVQEINLKILKIKSDVRFEGIDCSLAPYPYPLEDQSVAALIEELGRIGRSRGDRLFEFGDSGTLFLNSYLTDILKYVEKDFKNLGFGGVMYSLLEDTYLSQRYSEEKFDIDFLKLLSTTCGCGVDMVPLPYDVSKEAISGIIMDVAALSSILDKPLGIRVLPISGSRDGDYTEFKHPFFSNTKIRGIGQGITTSKLPGQERYFSFLEKRYVKS